MSRLSPKPMCSCRSSSSAADLLLTPDGRHVFREINPMGGFTGLQKRLGLPVADAIADLLTARVRPRV